MFNKEEIAQKLEEYKRRGLKLFLSSSFQTHSIPLLHMISSIDTEIPVYFLNTGYHFPETIRFKNEVSQLLGLNTIDLVSQVPKSMQKDAYGRLLFASNINHCCYLNKIQPLEPILMEKDVWINGVRAGQNANRSNFSVETKAPHGVIRYHPILHWTSKMIHEYAQAHDLPRHPLEEKGYFSVGCEPCTQSVFEMEDGRNGRWAGMSKTECGLHTELVESTGGGR